MARREEIIATAARVFKRKGFYSASLQDVADEIGINKGSLYYYINSKDELLLEIISSPMSIIQEKLRDVLALSGSWTDKILIAMSDHMQMYESHYYEVCVFFDILSHPPESIREQMTAMMREQLDLWLTIVKEGIAVGEFKEIDSHMVTLAILGMCTWSHQWVRKKGRLRMKEIADIFGHIVLKGILPDVNDKHN